MSTADSKPRPLPKPRVRHKSLPGSSISSTNIDSNVASSASANKPPVTKPKPTTAYKALDFNSKFLVSITADIDIEDGSTNSDQNNAQSNEDFEKNNNVTNLKGIDGGTSKIPMGNGISNEAKNIPTSGVKYGKPLPPLPIENTATAQEESRSVREDNSTTVNPRTFDMSKLPKKPPRLYSSASDSQLYSEENIRDSTDRNSVFVELNDTMAKKKKNPPLPRKPTCLRRSTGEETQGSSSTGTFCLGPPEMENTNVKIKDSLVKNENTASLNEVRTSREGMKIHTYSSDSQLGKLTKPSAFLKPSNKDNISNIGCTPPLPRKPARKLSPVAYQVSELWKNDNSKKTLKDDSGLGKSRSRSPQDEQRVSANSFPIKTDIKCDEDVDDIKCEGELINSPDQKDSGLEHSDIVSERSKHMPNAKKDDKQVNTGKSGPSTNQRKPLPAVPTSPNSKKVSNHSPPRRPPPSLPKRPSLEGKRRSGPPPLPNAPRPASIVQENAINIRHVRRSQSEGDIFGAATNEDAVYTEAYEHLRDSVYSAGSLKEADDDNDNDDDDDYELPNRDIVKGFMEARKKSQMSLQKKEVGLAGQATEHDKAARKASTTYSSSSDDSEHEYVEPVSPTPEKRTNQVSASSPTNTVSSSGSSNYVEAIHVSELAGKSGISDLSTGRYEFKPFNDMDSDWSEPKVIDWEYEGESDDSDASYVEPDEVDDLDEFDGDDDEAFTDEPLYQIYQAVVLEKERTLSLKRNKKHSIGSPPTTPGTFTLRSGTLRGGKMLWSQLPEVRNTGLLENVSAEQRKLQEAIFEVISSEASYLKSLNLLVDHFLKSQFFSADSVDSILDKHQIAELFSNIMEIVNVSERFLDDLRTRQRQSILIESVSDIISNHAANHFQAYVSYCSSQYKQDRALMNLRKTNCRFADALEKLERDPRVFGLTLQSFLVLPMQRVTRYPLLVDAIVRRCEPGHQEYYKTDAALKAVNQVVHKCNEGARNEERREEMLQIDKIIAFMKMNPIKLVVDDRWLLRRGPIQLLEMEGKSTLSNTLRGRFKKYRVKPIYLFLFSDLLVVTKRKTETMYSVIDYAKRNMIRIQESTSNAKNAFLLVFLENFEKKTKELNLRADNETDLTRWREAFQPPSASADDEKIYDSWDCPQVQALHNYQAQQSDELSLVPGDVVNVLRKLPDGWYEGERIRDGVCGWFPANHTEEIRNEHVRARNLHQRYRLLAASTAFLDKRKR